LLITRWQAPLTPSKELLMTLLEDEGLEPFFEENKAGIKVTDHRHPFSEVRVVVQGELIFSVAGNQTLLRAGDRIEIPGNTKHWHQAHPSSDCVCICAHRVF